MRMNNDSDLELLGEPASPSGIALLVLAVVGRIHPGEVVTTDAEWALVVAELETRGWLLGKEGDHYVIEPVDVDNYPGGLPQKARALCERNPFWRRQAFREIWKRTQQHSADARDFIAAALAEQVAA
jgi:hypothetical protein